MYSKFEYFCFAVFLFSIAAIPTILVVSAILIAAGEMKATNENGMWITLAEMLLLRVAILSAHGCRGILEKEHPKIGKFFV